MERTENDRRVAPCLPAGLVALLDFPPVPVRRRRDGWTPERQRAYVAALFASGHGGKAARAVGMSEQSAGKLRRRPGADGFARACEAAYRAARRRWAAARLASNGRAVAEVSLFLSSREAETYEPSETSAAGSRPRRGGVGGGVAPAWRSPRAFPGLTFD